MTGLVAIEGSPDHEQNKERDEYFYQVKDHTFRHIARIITATIPTQNKRQCGQIFPLVVVEPEPPVLPEPPELPALPGEPELPQPHGIGKGIYAPGL